MTHHHSLRIVVALTSLSVFLTGTPNRALDTTFTVTDLGTLGGDRSSAYGINSAGQIVGTSTTRARSTHAFLYDHGTLIDLGTFGGRDSMAYAISDTGAIAGRAQNALGDFRAFVASRNGGITLTDLTGLDKAFEAPFSTATGTNARGETVGYRQSTNEHRAARTRAFLFGGAALVDLGTFDGEDAVLTAVNDLGQFVGFFSTDSHADYASHRAFRVQQGGTAEDLGTLGGPLTTPTAINNRGRIVGFAQLPSGESRAFIYESGRLTSLGTLPGGRQSFAYGVNEPGDVVGASEAADGSLHAILYRGTELADLNTVIPAGSGWRLTEARAINAAGVIVGTGVIAGHQHAFMLTPAPPR